MSKPYDTIKILPVNKTVVFYSPLDKDGILVRTGTSTEGNSLYHSVLHAYSDEYINADKIDRVNFVKRLQASLSKEIDRKNWEKIGSGLIAKIPFQENLDKILSNFYNYMADDTYEINRMTKHVITKTLNTDSDAEIYKIMLELLPFDTLEKTILYDIYNDTHLDKISTCRNAIIKAVKKFLDENEELNSIESRKSEYLKDKIVSFFNVVFDESENAAFHKYVKSMMNNPDNVDSYTIELASNRFKRDIYFLNSSDRMPCDDITSLDNLKGRKSVILLKIAKNHYEVIGRLLPQNRVQREFAPTDPLIKKINDFLTKPEKISDLYPELVSYLPEKFKRSNSYDYSDSDRSNYSDSENSYSDSSNSS